MTALRKTVAIIGLGPKGLYALDALCQAARKIPSQGFEVHIFEPSPYPGAGPIYDPSQPDSLVMNFPARMIDAWTDRRGPDLLTWLKSGGKAVAAGDYVPRAEVGHYLNWCHDRIVADAPPNVFLTLHTETVTALDQTADGWKVLPNGREVDEVLVTTGHQDWMREGQPRVAGQINSPFPVDKSLMSAAVPAGTSVVCKGFALTFIDTMLALTEGRGGTFTKTGHGYAYHASGDEPAMIAPFSRTGRPMRAKVEADHFAPAQDSAFWEAQLSKFDMLLSAKPEATFKDDVWPAMQHIADRALGSAPGTSAAAFAEWQESVFDSDRCRSELRKGYEIAMGTRVPDIYWALGEVWRRCYPRLVSWTSHRALSQPDADTLRNVAAEMERLAFGPPAQNVGKLICLEDIGLVSLNHLSGDVSADITINATIPPPGGAALSSPLKGLLRDGYLSVGTFGGVIVNDRARALASGTATAGLSVIGRATEGSVLGNDTLSRAIHNLPERWADHIVCGVHARQDTRLEHIA